MLEKINTILPETGDEISKNQLQFLLNLYRKGCLQLVLDKTQKLINKYPNILILWNLMGASAAQIGKLDEAVLAFQKAISIKPDDASAYNNIGNVFQEQGKLKEAIEAHNLAIALKPDYAEAYNNLGNAFKDQGKLEESITAYNRALLIKTNYAEAYNNLGNALKDQGKLNESIDAYNKALSINTNYAEAYNNLGNALNEQGKLKEAIDASKKALSIKPNFADAYFNLGNALNEQGKLEEAIESYNRVLSIKPDFAVAYSNLGNALQEQGRLEEAIESYNKALSIKPDYAEAYNNATELLKIHSPKLEKFHTLFAIDSKIKKISEHLINAISIEDITNNLLEGLSFISKDKFEYKTPLSQIYRRNDIDLNCRRHKKIFDTLDIIPEFCFGCFKVQVEVATFIDLIKVTSLFYKFDFKVDLTKKTIIELRPNIPGSYKGLIYCEGLEQAKAVKTLLDADLKEVLGKNIESKIKRGCSEFPLKFPNYGKIAQDSKEMMSFPTEWKLPEKQFDQKKLIEPYKNKKESLAQFCLSDFYIIQKWIDYAKGLEDQSVEAFNDRPIIFEDIYEKAKQRINRF